MSTSLDAKPDRNSASAFGSNPIEIAGIPNPYSLNTRELGRIGEQLAAEYLTRKGIRVIDRNVRLGRGEIDLVGIDHSTLVIIEVKTRRTLVTGVPQCAVTPQKLRQLRQLTGRYLEENSPRHRDIRIDVIGILAHADGTVSIEHLEAVSES